VRIFAGSIVAAAMIGTSALTAFAGGSTTTTVRSFNDGSVVPGSSASLVRTDAGVSATLATSGLPVGDVVTMWCSTIPRTALDHPRDTLSSAAAATSATRRLRLPSCLPRAESSVAAVRLTTERTLASAIQAVHFLDRACSFPCPHMCTSCSTITDRPIPGSSARSFTPLTCATQRVWTSSSPSSSRDEGR